MVAQRNNNILKIKKWLYNKWFYKKLIFIISFYSFLLYKIVFKKVLQKCLKWKKDDCSKPVTNGVDATLIDASYSQNSNFGFVLDIKPNKVNHRAYILLNI